MARRSSEIKTFTSSGRSAPGTFGSGKLASIGVRLPDGTIYKRANIRLDGGIGNGGGVTVVNPKASASSQAQKRASLGMGNVGQIGRN